MTIMLRNKLLHGIAETIKTAPKRDQTVPPVKTVEVCGRFVESYLLVDLGRSKNTIYYTQIFRNLKIKWHTLEFMCEDIEKRIIFSAGGDD